MRPTGKITGVIFDLDGVVIDSEAARLNTYAQLIESEYGLRPTIVDKDLIGRPEQENIHHLLTLYGLRGNIKQLVKKRCELLLTMVPHQVSLVASVHSLLIHLCYHRIPCAIATNSGATYTEMILKRFRLQKHFKVVLTGEDVKYGKPNPEIFIAAASKLTADRGQCLVVEDSPSGLEAAQGAGMRCLAVLGSFAKKDLKGADGYLRRTEKLRAALLRRLGLPPTAVES